MGALACFFETRWSSVSPALSEVDEAWLLNEAASRLRALGWPAEALKPTRIGLEKHVKQEAWTLAATSAGNSSELKITLGEVAGAIADAEQAVTYADRSNDWPQRISKRTTHADALHQSGRRPEAEARFREAEAMQAEHDPRYPLLYSLWGFRYCDLLLAPAERAAWRCILGSSTGFQPAVSGILTVTLERAAKMFDWRAWDDNLLTIALDHLSLGRAVLYRAILEGSSLDPLPFAPPRRRGRPPRRRPK